MNPAAPVSGTLRALTVLLTRDEQTQAIRLAGLMLVAMVLETMGVGLILPAVAVLVRHLSTPQPGALLIGGLACLLVFSSLKSLFLVWADRRLNRFILGVQAGLSHRVFEFYLTQPWIALHGRNSAQLIRNTVTQVNQFVAFVVMPATTLVAEGLVMLGLVALLLVIEPRGAMAVLVLVPICGLIYQRAVGPRLVASGQSNQFHEGQRIQHIQQGLGGAKEVKVLGREQEFLRQYAAHNLSSAQAGAFHRTALQMPRILLEPLAIGVLAVLVGVMYLRATPVPAIAGVVALFAAAAVRLMPSANRVFGAVQSLHFGAAAATLLCEELTRRSSAAAAAEMEPRIPFQQAVQLENVTFTYPETGAPALDSVSMTIAAGECVGLVGPSGAGKTTALDVLLGLLTPQSGRVLVDGVDIRTRERGWQRQIGFVPQSSYLTDDTLRRNVAFGVPDHEIDDERVWAALAEAQLTRFVQDLPDGVETRVGERGSKLAGGQRQRIGIARALYHNPSVLVLDEPTSALDDSTQRDVMEAVRGLREKKTIILVAHRESTVAHCDRLYRLEEGRVVAQI